MVTEAFSLSERYEIPVILRPTTRVCHARQNVACREPQPPSREARFEKDPGRWAATPQFLTGLHKILNGKLDRIAADPAFAPRLEAGDGSHPKTCIIAAGVAFAHAAELLDALGLQGKIDLFQVRLAYPLHVPFIEKIRQGYAEVLVLERTDSVVEMQLADSRIRGRASGDVPRQGELTPDVIEEVLRRFLGLPAAPPHPPPRRGSARRSVRLRPPGGLLRDPPELPEGDLSQRHRLLHPRNELRRRGHLPLHGGLHQPGSGVLPCLRGRRGVPHGRRHNRDSTFFHAGSRTHQCRLPGGTDHPGDPRQRDDSDDRHQPTPQLGVRADGSPGRRS